MQKPSTIVRSNNFGPIPRKFSGLSLCGLIMKLSGQVNVWPTLYDDLMFDVKSKNDLGEW